jgi:hypothetical protein
MTNERYKDLMDNHTASLLTPEEWQEGWHYCPEWDFMLIEPNTPESESCTCTTGHKVLSAMEGMKP